MAPVFRRSGRLGQVVAVMAAFCVLGVSGAGGAQAATKSPSHHPVRAAHRSVPATHASHKSAHTTHATHKSTRTTHTTHPATSAKPHAAAPVPASCPTRPTLVVCVDQDDQRMWVQHGSKVVFPAVTVRTGRAGLRTPDGLYRIYWRHQNHFSHKFDEPMPYSLFFFHGYALHATYDDVRRGGSHGCVNLSLTDARRLFGMMNVGDLVYIWGHKHNA